MNCLMHLKPTWLSVVRTASRHIILPTRNKYREHGFHSVTDINCNRCGVVRSLCTPPNKTCNNIRTDNDDSEKENIQSFISDAVSHSGSFKLGTSHQRNSTFILYKDSDESTSDENNIVENVGVSKTPLSSAKPESLPSEKTTPTCIIKSCDSKKLDTVKNIEDSITCTDENKKQMFEFYVHTKGSRKFFRKLQDAIEKMDVQYLIYNFESIQAAPARNYWIRVITDIECFMVKLDRAEEIANGMDMVRNIIHYLETTDHKIDMLPIYSTTVCLVGNVYRANLNRMKCPEDHQSLVYECYRKMLDITKIFGKFDYSNLITGFLVTDQWQKVFEFFYLHSMIGQVHNVLLEHLIMRLCEEGSNPHIAHLFIQEFGNVLKTSKVNTGRRYMLPSPLFYKVYIKACVKRQNKTISKDSKRRDDEFSIENLFSHMRKHRWIATEITADDIIQYFHSSLNDGWKAEKGRVLKTSNYSSVLDYGHVCSVCRRTLGILHFSEKEFELLKEMTYQHVVIGDDLYNVSRPDDFKQMCDAVEKYGKFDVVIDAENQMFVNVKGIRKQKKVLLQTIELLKEKKMKVLVILKSYHQKKFIEELSKVATVIMLDNSLVDDIHYIYAAMLSGPQTYLLSNDLYKNHRSELRTFENYELFIRWQMCRQLTSSFKEADGGGLFVSLHWPPATDTYPQPQASNIHIPFHANDSTHRMGLPNGVLCLRK